MKIRSLLAVLLALVLIASGCSSDGETAAGDGTWPSKITFGFVPSQEQETL
ncbi:MAG: phosphate/phosphite/phosphonate ABC transporter substrate-binding protein, partial [Acidimicrobiaceae bacterium]|nr:phosphate/phosphite/phosphonate ABC transporter substrate-binding protein [Acidimicrobiaceae bacterium]